MPSFWRSAQRREVLSGVAVGLLGWMALGLAFLVPLFHYTSSQTVCVEGCVTTTIQGTDNLADLELPSWAWTLFVELLSLCLLCVLVSTVLHHRTGAEGWRRLLWASTVVLVGSIAWLCIAFAAYGVGVSLAPAALLALLAAWTSRRSQPQPQLQALPAAPLSRGGGQAERRSRVRALELLSGIAAGFLGVENMGIGVFAPLANQTTMGTSCIEGVCRSVEVRSKVNSVETGFIPLDGLIVVALLFICLLGIALSAVLDRHGEDTPWPSVLVFSTILLAGFVVWTALNTYAFFFGVVLVPGLALALVATCASVVGHARAASLVRN